MERSSEPHIDHLGTVTPVALLTHEVAEQSIPARFEEVVTQFPHRVAVKSRSDTLTYAALNHMANRIAHAILQHRGAGAETIAVLFEQGAPVIAAILGVLKAGKIYVALDPSFPQAQLTHMLDDSQAALIVTNGKHLALANAWIQGTRHVLNVDCLDAPVADENPDRRLSPDSIAHILYTSGSTGRSKGVIQTHRNVLHKIMVNTNSLGLSHHDHLSLLYSCGYSASVKCIFSAFLNGAAVYPFDVKKEGVAPISEWLCHERISVYFSVPTVFRSFVATLTGREQFPELRIVYLGGEPVGVRDVELYRKYLPDHCLLANSLSSNETGPIRQYFITKETQITSAIVPVGYATPDSEVLLLDDSGADVGVDNIGEIVVKSHYLTPGYWRLPELTEEAFTPAPDGGGARLYHTGDLGRLRPDGCLEHLGRKNFQVKIRGYRIDIPEIELALLSVENIREAVVVARQDHAGEPSLVAYVVPASQPAPTVSELRRALQGRFPAYMIPSAFVPLETLPLTATGKVDRRALPAPASTRPELATPFVAPRMPLEERVARIWAETLGLEQVGVNDQFLDLGGHSLHATQIVSRIRETFQVDIPLQSLLDAATVADMAALIGRRRAYALSEAELARLLAEVEGLSAGELHQPLTGGEPPSR
jgi:amino acid adenylation domain-containing protein